MPIYEYICPKCGLKFEILSSLSDFNKKVPCLKCQHTAQRLISPVSQHKAKNYLDKLNERQEEIEWKADQRIESDPLLKPENWLEHVKEKKDRERKLKKKIIKAFGKGPDAPMKYAASLENERIIRENDSFTSD